MGSMFEVIWGFALFAVAHSLLLTRPAHRALEAMMGQEKGRAWFRFVYSVVAFVSFGAYVAWAAMLPDSGWFELTGSLALLIYLVKFAGLALVWWGVAQFGFGTFSGIKAILRHRHGQDPVLGDPDLGAVVRSGPYAFMRHPLYTGGIVAVLANPTWSANRFGFALAATLYLVLGAYIEERRLLKIHGDSYRRYMAEVPGLIPRLHEGKTTNRGR